MLIHPKAEKLALFKHSKVARKQYTEKELNWFIPYVGAREIVVEVNIT